MTWTYGSQLGIVHIFFLNISQNDTNLNECSMQAERLSLLEVVVNTNIEYVWKCDAIDFYYYFISRRSKHNRRKTVRVCVCVCDQKYRWYCRPLIHVCCCALVGAPLRRSDSARLTCVKCARKVSERRSNNQLCCCICMHQHTCREMCVVVVASLLTCDFDVTTITTTLKSIRHKSKRQAYI